MEVLRPVQSLWLSYSDSKTLRNLSRTCKSLFSIIYGDFAKLHATITIQSVHDVPVALKSLFNPSLVKVLTVISSLELSLPSSAVLALPQKLDTLILAGVTIDDDALSSLPPLRKLVLDDSIAAPAHLSRLPASVKSLNLSLEGFDANEIELKTLKNLQSLSFCDIDSVAWLSELQHLKKLLICRSNTLSGSDLQYIPSSVEQLSILFCDELDSLSHIPSGLKSLTISECPELFGLDGLEACTQLEELRLDMCHKGSTWNIPKSIVFLEISSPRWGTFVKDDSLAEFENMRHLRLYCRTSYPPAKFWKPEGSLELPRYLEILVVDGVCPPPTSLVPSILKKISFQKRFEDHSEKLHASFPSLEIEVYR
eukprot:TRINITY_DN10874_c0_g1_i1.p1 TRINITY_DN10874_c0_g1~~TRINITY_DN10874_c0_g1_i1.p1  ORF type:complete len:368 (-),score=40.70 TRINITY_DN10874_c0_g1_i1:15-1118(-)